MQPQSHIHEGEPEIVTRAVARARSILGINQRELSDIIGLSQPQVSRLVKGNLVLSPNGKEYELALHFIRLYRSLLSVLGGDEAAARSWLRSENTILGDQPIRQLQTIQGLIHVTAYLDSRQAQL